MAGRARLRLWLAVLLSGLAGAVAAQQTPDPVVIEVQQSQDMRAILTVDIDRLFGQSQFGQRITQDFTTAGEQLAEENRRIADALRQEELALAAQRPDMDIEVFRDEAEAFDLKTQGIRRAQDAKEAALEDAFANGRDQFLEVTRPILGELMVANGALAILDRRSVLLSLGSIDITDQAIARIDEALGDGTGVVDIETGLDPDGAASDP